MNKLDSLKELYAKNSKHSNYQILPSRLLKIIGEGQIDVKSRYEYERLVYFNETIDFAGKSVLDIGGNSGYFSFEILEKGAEKVHHFEGNKAHSDFVALASEVLDCKTKMQTTNDYFLFDGTHSQKYDVILCLNVLHHLGDDYGDNALSIEKSKQGIIQQLNSLAANTSQLIFQMGFCWKGNRELLLFDNGTKAEMIEFITEGIKGVWKIEQIAVAEKNNGKIEYLPVNEQNIQRDDTLGEFLNRPIFILKSEHENEFKDNG